VSPIELLARWIDDAGGAARVDAIAMCLATADASGGPSARIVLLRGLDERGLRFYTSYESRKGRELTENPRAAVVFYWPQLERQVRIEGTVTRLSDEESDDYFAARPRGHRIAAWASEQSQPIESRETLQERFTHFEQRFDDDVPRPHAWGGYLLRPLRIEFWEGRPNRMHDRREYRRAGEEWHVRTLQP
jgi:pyridoxamine 5'-phosphate oxidase